jgi:chaperonin GroEL
LLLAQTPALKRGIDKAVEAIIGKRDENGVVVGGAFASSPSRFPAT